jgi:AcrR family transcriptional regulator
VTTARARTAGPYLDKATLVRAAADLADRDGWSRLTLSKAAESVDRHVSSLYTHVDGLDDLRRQIALLAIDELADRDPTPRLAWTLSCMPLSACEALGMWLLSGILSRYPDLKIVFVEPGLAWVAGYVSFLDDMVLRQGYEFPVLDGELPSFYYHRNLAMTFIDEPDPVRHLRHVLGARNLLWSSDYPHPVSTWPKSLAVIEETFEGVPDDERDLMVEGNAARIWNL